MSSPASPSEWVGAGPVASGGLSCGEAPGARPAPGRCLARPAHLLGLGPAWSLRPAFRGLGRQVSLPSLPPSPSSGARRVAAAWSGRLQAGPVLAPGYRRARNPVGRICTPGDCLVGNRAADPPGRGLHPASASPPCHRVPQTSCIFLAARSKVVLGRLESFRQQLWRGRHDALARLREAGDIYPTSAACHRCSWFRFPAPSVVVLVGRPRWALGSVSGGGRNST